MIERETNEDLNMAWTEIEIRNCDFDMQKIHMDKSPPPCENRLTLI